jgi:VWFA-related protein
MTLKRLAGVVTLVLLASSFAIAQGPNRGIGRNIPLPPAPEPEPQPLDIDDRFALSIDVEVHNVDVVVTDNDGNPLTGLQKEHFKVFVDDVEQTITNFRPTDSPLTIVLLIEFANTWGWYYDDVIYPAAGFIQSLREDDWAAIVSYDLDTEIITDFSQNQNQLINGLFSLTYPDFSETNLFDAVNFTLDRLENVDGKKAIFLLSTGEDTFSRANYGDTLRRSEESDTMIYAVGMGQMFRTMYENRMSSLQRMNFLQAEVALRSIAQNTGGEAWFPRFRGEYASIYEGVSFLMRNQYSIGFVPKDLEQDDDLRKIRVEVAPIDLDDDGDPEKLKVRHKKGFYNYEEPEEEDD